MAVQAAWSADASPLDRSSLGWLILIPLGCLVLGQALLALTGAVPVFDGTLADPNSYMRLSRVLQLHETGSWFELSDFFESTRPMATSSTGPGRSTPSCWPAPGCSSRRSASSVPYTSGACWSARSAWP